MRAIDWISLTGIVVIVALALAALPRHRRGTPRIRRAQHVRMMARNGRLVRFEVIESEEEDL